MEVRRHPLKLHKLGFSSVLWKNSVYRRIIHKLGMLNKVRIFEVSVCNSKLDSRNLNRSHSYNVSFIVRPYSVLQEYSSVTETIISRNVSTVVRTSPPPNGN